MSRGYKIFMSCVIILGGIGITIAYGLRLISGRLDKVVPTTGWLLIYVAMGLAFIGMGIFMLHGVKRGRF